MECTRISRTRMKFVYQIHVNLWRLARPKWVPAALCLTIACKDGRCSCSMASHERSKKEMNTRSVCHVFLSSIGHLSSRPCSLSLSGPSLLICYEFQSSIIWKLHRIPMFESAQRLWRGFFCLNPAPRRRIESTNTRQIILSRLYFLGGRNPGCVKRPMLMYL